MTWYENADGGCTTWTTRDIRASYSGAWPLAIVDVDQNGLLDVACAAYYAGVIRWWKVAEFRTAGALTSSILDAGALTEDLMLDWAAIIPASSGLSVEARAGNNPADLGAWSAPLSSPGAVPGLSGRYLQYRVHLETSAAQASPIVDWIELGWQPSAGLDDRDESERCPWATVSSPARRSAAIRFHLTEPGPVCLEAFDAGGRLVWRMARRGMTAGDHTLRTPPLGAGCYLYRLVYPGGSLCLRGVAVD